MSTQAATGGTADHITVEYRKHEVAGASFLIWDTWGLAGTGQAGNGSSLYMLWQSLHLTVMHS